MGCMIHNMTHLNTQAMDPSPLALCHHMTKAAKSIYLFAVEITVCARHIELKRLKALKDATNLLRK